jgi:excinuclease ABC subunit C
MEFERAAALRDRIRALTRCSNQGINPSGVAEADVVAAAHGGRAGLRAGVLHPRATRAGATATSTRGPGRGRGAGNPAGLPGSSTTTSEPPRLILLSHEVEDPDLLGRGAVGRRGARWRSPCRSGARRPNWWRTPPATRAKALARRMAENRGAGEAAGGAGRGLRAGGAAAADRGLRQLPHPGHRCRGRDGGGGAEGFLKSQYRKFNIKGDRHHPRRRLRHDEGGADPPLRAPAEGGPRPRKGMPGPTSC